MNARLHIFGCLCLVGANGTAAAADVDFANRLLSSMGGAVSSSFEGAGSRASQGGGHDGGDVVTRPASVAPRSSAPTSPVASPVDADQDMQDSAPTGHSSAPNWQSMLPGSIF